MILHLLIVRHSRYQLTFYLNMILFSHNYHNHSKKRCFPNILASFDICIKLFKYKSTKNDILAYAAYKNIEEIRPMVNGSLPLESEKQIKTNMLKAISLSTQPKQESICFNRDSWGSFCWPRSKADLIGISMSVVNLSHFELRRVLKGMKSWHVFKKKEKKKAK